MTAITYADRSTRIWGDDALGPKDFEAHEILSEDQRKERTLYENNPELEYHVDTEWAVLKNWVAFKMAPTFVEQIYNGEPLQIDRDSAINDHIIPEYSTSRRHYVSEAAHIIGTHIPELKDRIETYTEEANRLDEAAERNFEKIRGGDRSPKLYLDASSWNRQSVLKLRLVQDLEADIPKAELNVLLKQATCYRISDLLARLERGERTAFVDDVVLESKKMAIEQVIGALKSDRARAEAEGDEDETIIRGYNRKLELLEIELRAFEDVISEDTEQIEAPREQVPEPSHFLKELQRRIIGSAGSRAAAFYDSFVK